MRSRTQAHPEIVSVELRAHLADVENELERFAGATAAGVDPSAFTERINRPGAQRC